MPNPVPQQSNALTWFTNGVPVATPLDLMNMGYTPNHAPNTATSVMRQLSPNMNTQMLNGYLRAEQNNPLQMFQMAASTGDK